MHAPIGAACYGRGKLSRCRRVGCNACCSQTTRMPFVISGQCKSGIVPRLCLSCVLSTWRKHQQLSSCGCKMYQGTTTQSSAIVVEHGWDPSKHEAISPYPVWQMQKQVYQCTSWKSVMHPLSPATDLEACIRASFCFSNGKQHIHTWQPPCADLHSLMGIKDDHTANAGAPF